MYDQILGDALFIMLYAVVAVLAALGSCYLLFRRGNAFAADVTPPLRLRRWTAALLAVAAVNHLWYMPILFLSTEADIQLCDLIGGLLDSMSFFPLSIVVMITMLQDRRRPLWPIAVAFAPLVMVSAWSVITRSYDFPLGYAYSLLLCVGLFIYMVRETWRYSRWLRENYADLEHKEVWQSMALLGIIMLVYVFYALAGKGSVFIYVFHVVSLVLVLYLPWRVDTLSDLSNLESHQALSQPLPDREEPEASLPSDVNDEQIATLLKQKCEKTGIYRQHDLTLAQLAKCLGTNRTYLSLYFSHQGINYNSYINDLRIDYFTKSYQESVNDSQPATAQELAMQSGYHSYRTFSVAFRQRMGLGVKEWMTTVVAHTD